MSDDQQQGENPTPSAGTPNTETQQGNQSIPYERFAEVNRRMREYEGELERLRKAQVEREEADRLKRGEHEAVINELKPKAERAAALETTLKGYLEAELADIPEEARYLFEGGDPAVQLQRVKDAKSKGLFNRANAPVTDAGAQGTAAVVAKLTSEELAAAARMGVSAEDYAKYKPKK